MKASKMTQVVDKVKEFFSEHVVPVYKIVSINPIENGWDVEVEVIEETDYMIASAKDEMIGVYKVFIDSDLEIVYFSRNQLRPRGAIE